jgi:hypothetical protein
MVAGMKDSRQKSLFETDAGEENSLTAIQKRWQQLARSAGAVANAKPVDAEGFEKFESAFKKLRDVADFKQDVEELHNDTGEAIRVGRLSLVAAFRAAESEFVSGLKKEGKSPKEGDSSWRIGRIELEVRREQAQVRSLYNRVPLTSWRVVSSSTEFQKLIEESDKKLDDAEIPDAMRDRAIWDAYDHLCSKAKSSDPKRSARISLQELYREVRVAIVRAELSSGQPDRKLKYAELPKWAYLFNIDRYRATASDRASHRVLALETGSQKESARALTFNGLKQNQEYKRYCWATAQQVGRTK